MTKHMGFEHVKLKLQIIVSTNRRHLWILFWISIATFLVILPWFLVDCPYSSYFRFSSLSNPAIAKKVIDQNRIRLEDAKKYLKMLDAKENLLNYKRHLEQKEISVIVGVITVKRLYGPEDGGYLTQTVATFDKLFKSDKSFTSKGFFICNAHAGPGNHTEANWLSQYFPTSVQFMKPNTTSVIMNLFEKEKQDYVYCMKQAQRFQSKYVLLVEDDALPMPELFKVLKYVLDMRINKRQSKGHSSKSWAYLKLFYPRKWQGFGSDWMHYLELLSISSIGGGVCVLILSVAVLYRRRPRLRMDSVFYNIVFMEGMVYSLMVAVLVSRQSLLELRRLSPALWNVVPAPDCCSPGILYNKYILPGLIQYLESVQSQSNFGVDLALEKYVNEHGYDKFLTEPNLFNHIGYISTLKGPSSQPAMFLQ